MIFFIIISVILLLFGFVVLFGAPYLPTLKAQQETALDLLSLKPGQKLVELGSGDGRMLKAAAKRGIYSTGFELNPILVLWSRLYTFRYRDKITIKTRNFWAVPLPQCDGIYVFLLDKYMKKLDKKVTQQKHNSVALVSFAFVVPGKKHITEKNGLYLYKYNNEKH